MMWSTSKIRKSRVLKKFLVALFAIATTGAFADHQPEHNSGAIEPTVENATEPNLDYRTQLRGIEDETLRVQLQSALDLLMTRQRPLQSLTALEHRVGVQLEKISTILRAEGYYSSAVDYDIDQNPKSVTVTMVVEQGPRFVLTEYKLDYRGPGSQDPELPDTVSKLGINLEVPAQSEFILRIEHQLLRHLGETGHPLALIDDREVVVDHGNHTMSVTLQITPGKVLEFGKLTVQPLPTVDEDYVKSFMTWEKGELFDQGKIDEFRSKLLRTGLFEVVRFEVAASPDGYDRLPIDLNLSERKHRTVGLGAHWSTDEGLGAEVFWEHRNLSGRQETLFLSASVEEIRSELDLRYRKPWFRMDEQSLLGNIAFSDEDTDAYSGPLLNTFLGVERQINEKWVLTPGLWFEESDLEDFQGDRKYHVRGFSMQAKRDTSNNLLDPSKGSVLKFSIRPYTTSGQEQLELVEAIVSATTYYSLGSKDNMVLANRVKIGSVAGGESALLPANRRFYAGGGSSVRGYALQSVGPIAPNGRPTGGTSLIELGAEIRYRANEVLGGVLFFDGGNVYEDASPDFSQELRWAAGIGVRYYTLAGPIGIDVAFPLNGRPTDDSFQLYISVGQAF